MTPRSGQSALDDATIQKCVVDSGVIPELVEWYGNPEHKIVLRIEVHIGRYIETDLLPWMTPEDITDAIKRASERLDRGE